MERKGERKSEKRKNQKDRERERFENETQKEKSSVCPKSGRCNQRRRQLKRQKSGIACTKRQSHRKKKG